jgi:catechol 2,3-dioxygenase-like lactoylglutathione lyase family enzyme
MASGVAGEFSKAMADLAGSVRRSTPMFLVPDMRATVSWYESIGFTVADRYEENGELVFARLTFGNGELALGPGPDPGPREVSLWFFTDRVRELYSLLKAQEVQSAHLPPDASAARTAVRFDEELYEPFYGGHQFSIRDNNGLSLVFWHPAWLGPAASSSAQS